MAAKFVLESEGPCQQRKDDHARRAAPYLCTFPTHMSRNDHVPKSNVLRIVAVGVCEHKHRKIATCICLFTTSNLLSASSDNFVGC